MPDSYFGMTKAQQKKFQKVLDLLQDAANCASCLSDELESANPALATIVADIGEAIAAIRNDADVGVQP